MTTLFVGTNDDSPIVLRPYQNDNIDAVEKERAKGVQRTLTIAPTGTGKTTVFVELGRREIDKGGSMLVLAHREELLDQARDRVWQQIGGHVPVGIEAGPQRANVGDRIVVAGVQSVGRVNTKRLSWFRPTFVVCDEAHHAPADSYMEAFRRFGCFDDDRNTFLVGTTATPHRMDNKPLHGSERGIFESIAHEYTLRQAIFDKWLCDIRGFRARAGYSLDGIKTTAGDYNAKQLAERVNVYDENLSALKHWKDVASDRRTIVFCVDIQHATDVASMFRDHGVNARHVDSKMEKAERRATIQSFRDGTIDVLVNCQIATEGLDVPEIACVLLMRPTKSWALYTQMIGRGLRILDGKDDCIVLDVVGVSDDKKLASVPGILGLPRIDMGGATATEVLEKFDDLSDYHKSLIGQREIDFASIDEVLREVDILGELSPSEEVQSASPYSWLTFGDDKYVISAGSSRDGEEKNREAVLQADPLGVWHLTVRSNIRNESVPLGGSFEDAIAKADQMVNQSWPGIGALVDANAAWRKRKPTPKQVEWLTKMGVAPETIAQMTMGEASAKLDRLFKRNKR